MPFQVTMRRFGRKLDVEALRARAAAVACSSSIACCRDGEVARRPAARASASTRSQARCRPRSLIPRIVTATPPRPSAFLRRGARARPRRRDGEGARRAVRGRAARRGLAQDQARAHARPRGARRRVGQRPAQRLALEPAPRRARSGERRLRHARQDVQGPDRRDARMADAGVSARGKPRATP